MDYKQVKHPNLNIVGREGMCLAYVTEVFGVAAKYPTATEGWNDAARKHAGSTPPANVVVPVWFSYNGPDGHVAVWVPGKGIYSTSAQGDKVFASVEALVQWMGEGFKYLGWSEDLNGVRVVEEITVPASSTPPAAAKTTSYTLTKSVPGFRTADDAASHKDQADTVPAGKYSVYNQADGMVNVTGTPGKPGSWINPKDNGATKSTELAHVVTVQAGWGLEAIADAAELANPASANTWAAIAKANGSNDWRAFNAALKPGQKVIIP